MRYGEFADQPLRAVLTHLAAASTTGCLRVGAAGVYLREGRVCGVDLPGFRPELGDRLVSSGVLAPEALAEALDAAPASGGLAGSLVRLGYVDPAPVEAFVTEQILDGCSGLLHATAGRWELTEEEAGGRCLTTAVPAGDLLAQVAERDRTWAWLAELVPGPAALPALSSGGLAATPVGVSGDAWSVLCRADGRRCVAELAGACGFTMFEATYVVAELIRAGLLEITDPLLLGESLSAAALLSELSREQVHPVPAAEPPPPAPKPAVLPAPRGDNDTASLMRELSFLGVEDPPATPAPAPAHRPYSTSGQRKRKGLFGR